MYHGSYIMYSWTCACGTHPGLCKETADHLLYDPDERCPDCMVRPWIEVHGKSSNRVKFQEFFASF